VLLPCAKRAGEYPKGEGVFSFDHLCTVLSLLYTRPMQPLLTDKITTPIGEMVLIARDGVVLLLEFDDSKDRYMREIKARFGDEELQQSSNPFGFPDIVRDYFEGNLQAIDKLKADGGGTAFEQKVWAELRAIPCGVTKSYGEIARKLGDINLSRAVGTANGRNPIAIVVPCHRVIGSNGTMTGYAGGLHRKQWLLRHEGALLI
jgi:methylated-DNA-[protein]-cysteine S-methyltransferase